MTDNVFEEHSKKLLATSGTKVIPVFGSSRLQPGTLKKPVIHDTRGEAVDSSTAANTHSFLCVAGGLPVATVQSPAANPAAAAFLRHLSRLEAFKEDGGLISHVSKTCGLNRNGPVGGGGGVKGGSSLED